MRAFVTGGTGFVGSHLVDTLLAEGHDVTCLVRSPAKAQRIFGARSPVLVEGDLESDTALARGLDGARIVFHVAGLTAAIRPDDFFRINRDATRRVLEHAAAAGAQRFVLVSSLAAAGPSPRGAPRAEPAPAQPVSRYGESKLAAEAVVRDGPLPWTIVRPPTVYGPRDPALLRLFTMARRGIVPVFGDGGQELSLIYATDLARALVAAAQAPAGQVYCAAHPAIVTATELARAVLEAVGGPDARGRVIRIPDFAARGALWLTGALARVTGRATLLSPDKANEFLASAWTCTSDRLASDTGWRAEIDPVTGLARTAAWYRERGWL